MELEQKGFSAFDAQHVCVLLVTLGLMLGMSWVARCGAFPRWTRVQTVVLAALLLLVYPLSMMAARASGIALSLGNILPMHLCDWAAGILCVALLCKRPLLAELGYFWGLCATLQGLLTPDLDFGWPHSVFLIFFLHHAGVVLAAVYLVAGLGRVPRAGAVWRVFLWTQGYVVTASILNVILKTNYGFLCAKPGRGSLLDYMGPWPYYILSMEGLCLLFLLIFNAPFFFARKISARKIAS